MNNDAAAYLRSLSGVNKKMDQRMKSHLLNGCIAGIEAALKSRLIRGKKDTAIHYPKGRGLS